MPKFRKKPVVVDAWPVQTLLKAAAEDWQGLPGQVRYAYDRGYIIFLPQGIDIKTLESNEKTGLLFAEYTDMLICGIKGELYPCKPDIFETTYELVPETHENG